MCFTRICHHTAHSQTWCVHLETPTLMHMTPLVQTPATNTGERVQLSHSLGAPSAGAGSRSVLSSLQECCPEWAGKHWHSNSQWALLLSHHLGYQGECAQERIYTVQAFSKPPAAVMLDFNTEQQEGTWGWWSNQKPAPVWKVKKFCLFIWRGN